MVICSALIKQIKTAFDLLNFMGKIKMTEEKVIQELRARAKLSEDKIKSLEELIQRKDDLVKPWLEEAQRKTELYEKTRDEYFSLLIRNERMEISREVDITNMKRTNHDVIQQSIAMDIENRKLKEKIKKLKSIKK